MKVKSTNPLVQQTVDAAFCIAREHFDIQFDDLVFGDATVICYLDRFPNEKEFFSGAVSFDLAEKKMLAPDIAARSVKLMSGLFTDDKAELTALYASDPSDDAKATKFGWIGIKIKDFGMNIERKYLKFNLKRLSANVTRVFSFFKLVKKSSEADFAGDFKFVHEELRKTILQKGIFKDLRRE